MSERRPCLQPECGCDYERWMDDDEEKTYCTDTGTPILCQIPELKCKYPEIECEHKNYYSNDEAEENALCQAILKGITECPLKIYEGEGEHWSLQETITKSPCWNLRGFLYYKDQLIVDEKIIRAIMSWAGDCTEPNSGIYKDPDAMFNALDLIYKLIDECAGDKPVIIENKDHPGDTPTTVYLKQIKSVSNHMEAAKMKATQEEINEEIYTILKCIIP